jgi:predicted esterase
MASMVVARTIAVSTHGRYIVQESAGAGPWRLLIGFHGYAEAAEIQFERLRSIPVGDSWLRVSVQALHRFYRGRTTDVVASWMTRQDRELAIDDNITYVQAVVDDVSRDRQVASVAFAGFSQGVAMAFRAAARLELPVAGVVAIGGDVPPELGAAALANTHAVLLGRGSNDQWYGAQTLASDVARLREAGVHVDVLEFEGGHEWTDEFSLAAARFLNERR